MSKETITPPPPYKLDQYVKFYSNLGPYQIYGKIKSIAWSPTSEIYYFSIIDDSGLSWEIIEFDIIDIAEENHFI